MTLPATAKPPTPQSRPEAEVFRDLRRNVEINIGKACNNRCVFCIDGLPKAEDRSYMPWEQMRTELEAWYTSGTRSVGFLGGEPTTYPHIVPAVAYARELGYTRVTIATNATKLRLTHFTDKLLDAGLTRVTVSMHGHTAELEDRLTRVPGNFHKKVTALRYLVKKREEGHLADNVSVNIVLNGWNYMHLPQMLRFFFRLGLDDVRANFIRTEGYAEEDLSLTPRFADVVPVLIKAVLLNEHHFRKSFTFGGFPMCVLPLELLANRRLARKYIGEFRDLDTDCSIRADHDHGLARVTDGRARFNWQDRKRFDLKRHLPQCAGCRYAEPCEGVWGFYLGVHGGGEFAAIP